RAVPGLAGGDGAREPLDSERRRRAGDGERRARGRAALARSSRRPAARRRRLPLGGGLIGPRSLPDEERHIEEGRLVEGLLTEGDREDRIALGEQAASERQGLHAREP